ncbi:MAG: DUF308 domain-containing protein [Proteobacteria bacterium]|nr:DUF308 domain-containing protein [Pseudomonadota bacterium]
MSEQALDFTLFHTKLHAASRSLLGFGLAMAALGAAAIAFPMFSTFIAAGLVGWVFLISGILMFLNAFSIHGTGPFFGALLISLLSVVAGAFLVFNPLAGEVGLTIVMGAVFLVQGAYEIAFAMEMRPRNGWFWMLISGLASLVLALVIAAGLPAISTIVLGILLGINLLTTGIGYTFIGLALRQAK